MFTLEAQRSPRILSAFWNLRCKSVAAALVSSYPRNVASLPRGAASVPVKLRSRRARSDLMSTAGCMNGRWTIIHVWQMHTEGSRCLQLEMGQMFHITEQFLIVDLTPVPNHWEFNWLHNIRSQRKLNVLSLLRNILVLTSNSNATTCPTHFRSRSPGQVSSYKSGEW
jgi:hypothetical protein